MWAAPEKRHDLEQESFVWPREPSAARRVYASEVKGNLVWHHNIHYSLHDRNLLNAWPCTRFFTHTLILSIVLLGGEILPLFRVGETEA